MNENINRAINELTKDNIKTKGPILTKVPIIKTIGKYGIIVLPKELIKEWYLDKNWKVINENSDTPHLLFTIQKVFHRNENENKEENDYTEIHNLDGLKEELKIQMYVGDYTIADVEAMFN